MHEYTGLVAFDLETTGLDKKKDQPVSYALVWEGPGGNREEYSIVTPTVPISEDSIAKHGITEEIAATGIPLTDALRSIGNALLDARRGGELLIGMNISFDLTILDNQLRSSFGKGLLEKGWNGPVMDVYVIDRLFGAPRSGPRDLEALCSHYGATLANAHNALGDAQATLDLAKIQLARYPRLRDMSPAELLHIQRRGHLKWLRNLNDYRIENSSEPIDIPDGWPIDHE